MMFGKRRLLIRDTKSPFGNATDLRGKRALTRRTSGQSKNLSDL